MKRQSISYETSNDNIISQGFLNTIKNPQQPFQIKAQVRKGLVIRRQAQENINTINQQSRNSDSFEQGNDISKYRQSSNNARKQIAGQSTIQYNEDEKYQQQQYAVKAFHHQKNLYSFRQKLQSRGGSIRDEASLRRKSIHNQNNVQLSGNFENGLNSKKTQSRSITNTTNHKQLCNEMLQNVLKVPYCNRPNRGMIKQMLIQQNQVNNLFSEKNLSFKKQFRIAEVRKNHFINSQLQNYPSINQQDKEVFRKSLYSLPQSAYQNQTMNTSQYIVNFDQQTNPSSSMWEMPNLHNRGRHIEVQDGCYEDDNNSVLEVSKVDLKRKERQERSAYYNPKYPNKRNTSLFATSTFSTKNNPFVTQNCSIQMPQQLLQQEPPLIILNEESSKVQLDSTEIQGHMEIKITKPKTSCQQQRNRRDSQTSFFEEDIMQYSRNDESKNMGQNSQKHLLNSKISVFMHLAPPSNNGEKCFVSTERQNNSFCEISKKSLDANNQHQQLMNQEISRAYQNIQFDVVQSILKSGIPNSHRSILSRSKILLLKQMQQSQSQYSSIKVFKNEQLKNINSAFSSIRSNQKDEASYQLEPELETISKGPTIKFLEVQDPSQSSLKKRSKSVGRNLPVGNNVVLQTIKEGKLAIKEGI